MFLVLVVQNHAQKKSSGEAPFAFYVGRIRRGRFQPELKRHTIYRQWQQIGLVRDGRFDLAYTSSPLANDGGVEASSDELTFIPLELAQLADKQRLFARAVAPDQIEICTAPSLEALEQEEQDNTRTLELC